MSDNFKNELFDAILSLSDKEACERFFQDLCTERELIDLSARLRVAKLLDSGVNYNDIAGITGASTATISRVSKCLSGEVGGYRAVLSRDGNSQVKDIGEENSFSNAEKIELAISSLFKEHTCLYKEADEICDYNTLAAYPECRDNADIIVFQNTNGKLLSLTPDPVPALASVCDEGKFSYKAKIFKRCQSSVFAEKVLGVQYFGTPSLAEKKEIVSLALSASKIKNRNSQLSIFDCRILNFVFDRYEIPKETEKVILCALESKTQKMLCEILEDANLTPDTYEIFMLLANLPSSYTEALQLINKKLPYDEIYAVTRELSEILSGLDKRRVKISPVLATVGEGLTFSSRKASLSGREYINSGRPGLGFKMKLE